MNENTMKIGIEVDSANGIVSLRRFGTEMKSTAAKGEKSFKTLSKETGDLEESTGKLRDEQGRFTASSNKSIASVGKLGIAFGVTAAAAVALMWKLASDGVSSFASFESGMIGVQKTTDFVAEEMAIFREEISSISKTVPVATDKLLGIAEVAGQLGIKGVENVANFTETLAKLELATDVVGEEGAADIARLLTVTGEGVGVVDDFGDVLVALGNNSAATEREILGLATEVAQATSTFSVGSTESLALGAAMKSLGVRAELGGSVVGRAMRSIEASIAAGGDEMKHLSQVTGIAEDKLKEAFGDDATAVFQKWLVGIGGVIDGGTSAADALAAFGLKGEEVLKVLPTMAMNSGVLEKALKLAHDEVERGTALDIEAAKASESLESQWQLTKNRANEISVELGEGLAPVVGDMLEDFGDWYDANDKVIQQDLRAWIEGITPLLTGMAGIVTNLAQSMAGWSAVMSDRLDFSDFATMDDGELTDWLHRSANGVLDLEEKLESLSRQREEVSLSWAMSSTERQAKQDRLSAIDLEKKETRNLIGIIEGDYKGTWADAYDHIERSHTEMIEERVASDQHAHTVGVQLLKATAKESKVIQGKELDVTKANANAKRLIYDELGRSHTEMVKGQLVAERHAHVEGVQLLKSAARESDVMRGRELHLIKANANAKRLVYDKSSADAIEAEARAVEDRLELAEKLSDKTQRLVLDDCQYKKWALGKEIQDLEDKAGDDIALHKEISDYQLASLAKIEKENKKVTDNMSGEWQKFADDFSKSFGSRFGDAIQESFGEIDNAWDALWISMVATLAEKTGEMAVDWAMSGVSNLFDGWDIFHDGSWDIGAALERDELPAIIQKGEMIIPRSHAQQIRDNLGGLGSKGDSFGALVESTQHASILDWDDNLAGAFGRAYLSDIKSGVISQAVAGSFDPMGLLESLVRPDIALGNVSEAAQETGLDAFGAWGNWSNIGQMLAKASVMMGLTGGPVTGLVASFAGLAGGFLGDRIGDALDDREWEGLKDGLEAGYITREEYEAAVKGAEARGIHHGSVLGTVVDTVSAPFEAVSGWMSDAFDAVANFSSEVFGFEQAPTELDPKAYTQMADIVAYEEAMEKIAIGDFSTSGKSFDDWYESATQSAKNTVQQQYDADRERMMSSDMYERWLAEGKITRAYNPVSINDGWNTGGWQNGYNNQFSYSGGGDGGRADGRGYGSNDQSSSKSRGDGGTNGLGGYAKGGVVKSLYVPEGDDGFAPLAFNEGVVDADTMTVLSAQIRNGSLGGAGAVVELRALRQEMGAVLFAVADNTRKTAAILRQWNAVGMPTEGGAA